MSALQTIVWSRPRPTDGIGRVNEGVNPFKGNARRGRGATDKALSKLLCEALDNLGHASCSFWACEGPSKPQYMATCVKCWAMRDVANVLATLQARGLVAPATTDGGARGSR